jgi:LDH2 family malate/lactate/ureidoglycolate dehydrogenase
LHVERHPGEPVSSVDQPQLLGQPPSSDERTLVTPAAHVHTTGELAALAKEILERAGADEENASIVADHLAAADECGVHSHGIVHLPGYVDDIEAGRIEPAAKSRLIRDEPTYALVSGNWTFGQVAAQDAVELGIAKARETGIALVGLVECHHIGRLGHFVELAAGRGAISMVWAGGYAEEDPHSAPYGGRERVLGTNPIAFGFPGREEPPMSFDFATTAVAGMKVVTAKRRGEQLPPGSIIDRDGAPTTDPEAFFDGGAHVSFGGHKGYAIAMAAEWLGRILTGSDAYADSLHGGRILGHQGVTFIVVRADLFTPLEQFHARADEMFRRTGKIAPAPGFDRVRLPGELEARAREGYRANGVPIEDAVWETLIELRDRVAADAA